MKTLVYHAGALGDFLAMLPAMEAWRQAHPRDRIILLGKPVFGEVGIHSGYFDEVWDADGASWAWLFAPGADYPPCALKLFSGITCVVLFTAEEGAPVARLQALGIPEVRTHNPLPPRRISIFRHYLGLINRNMEGLAEKGPSVDASPRYAQSAQALLKGAPGAVALHAGSGSAVKNWPGERFRTVAELLRSRGFPVVWLSGPVEASASTPEGCLTADNVPLPALIHLFKQCRAYIGNDSGISHLAAAAGCPSVVLFGPSDPAVWKPVGAHVRTVVARSGCSPCHRAPSGNKTCPSSCMDLITVEAVIETFDRLLGIEY